MAKILANFIQPDVTFFGYYGKMISTRRKKNNRNDQFFQETLGIRGFEDL
jgi:hypothetical protein